MGRRRSGTEVVLIALYWLSGLALIVEPVRFLVGGQARSKRAQRKLMAEQAALLQTQQAYAAAGAARANQQAWAEWDRRNREAWAAQEAHRRAQPVACRHCRHMVTAGAARCEHCGAPT